jgi:hypothetical protein
MLSFYRGHYVVESRNRRKKFRLIIVRRMTRVLLATLSLISIFASAFAGEQPLHVTVQQLLATPQKFAGKRVDVTGWYVAYAEDSQLFSSRSAASGHLDDSIWLEPQQFENRAVRVIGTFHYQPKPDLGKSVPYARRLQGFGSYRLNKRAILNITYIQPAH